MTFDEIYLLALLAFLSFAIGFFVGGRWGLAMARREYNKLLELRR